VSYCLRIKPAAALSANWGLRYLMGLLRNKIKLCKVQKLLLQCFYLESLKRSRVGIVSVILINRMFLFFKRLALYTLGLLCISSSNLKNFIMLIWPAGLY